MIMDIIWKEDCNGYSRKAIHKHISNIKKKINAISPNYNSIVSIHGVGYKFDEKR